VVASVLVAAAAVAVACSHDPPPPTKPTQAKPSGPDAAASDMAMDDLPDAQVVEEGRKVAVVKPKMMPPQRQSGDLPAGASEGLLGDGEEVVVQLCIDALGKVTDVHIERCPEGADGEIVDKLGNWKFSPYTRDGAPQPLCFPTVFRMTPPKPQERKVPTREEIATVVTQMAPAAKACRKKKGSVLATAAVAAVDVELDAAGKVGTAKAKDAAAGTEEGSCLEGVAKKAPAFSPKYAGAKVELSFPLK
jgi:hypothetical protein